MPEAVRLLEAQCLPVAQYTLVVPEAQCLPVAAQVAQYTLAVPEAVRPPEVQYTLVAPEVQYTLAVLAV